MDKGCLGKDGVAANTADYSINSCRVVGLVMREAEESRVEEKMSTVICVLDVLLAGKVASEDLDLLAFQRVDLGGFVGHGC